MRCFVKNRWLPQLDIEREYFASCEADLASCGADFATAATKASRLAYNVHQGTFALEGIDVTRAPPGNSLIQGNLEPSPSQSFTKLR